MSETDAVSREQAEHILATVQADSLTEYDGHVVGFCNPGCRDKFESAVRHFEEAKRAARLTLD